jgi:hypothetical protein
MNAAKQRFDGQNNVNKASLAGCRFFQRRVGLNRETSARILWCGDKRGILSHRHYSICSCFMAAPGA